MNDARTLALKRVARYVIVPALLTAIDALTGYLQSGTLAIDWRVVGVVSITAALAGLSKWLREETRIDVKIV